MPSLSSTIAAPFWTTAPSTVIFAVAGVTVNVSVALVSTGCGFAAEPLRYALETERYTVADLPGDLDDDAKLVLIRRLVREGLVRVLF